MAAGRRRGPAPQPVELKRLRGNPGHRPLPPAPPAGKDPAIGAPQPPAWLDQVARQEWRRLRPELERLGLWRKLDRALFASYCHFYSVFINAIRESERNQIDLVVLTKSGYPIQNPYLAIINTAFERMRALAGEFGFTPSSRTRLALETATAGNEFDTWLKRRGQGRGGRKPRPSAADSETAAS